MVWGADEGGQTGLIGTERYFAVGNGSMMQCAGNVLLSCTLETCMVLGTSVTPINSIKNNNIKCGKFAFVWKNICSASTY